MNKLPGADGETIYAKTPLYFSSDQAPNEAMNVEWAYAAADPYAISAVFNQSPQPSQEWKFGRALLRELIASTTSDPVGIGDIQFGKHIPSGQINIALKNPNGESRVAVPYAQLVDFINATYELVAPGTESDIAMPQLDITIAEILNGDTNRY